MKSTQSGLSEAIPACLLEPPDQVVNTPPVQTRVAELDFSKLTWENFERLLVRLLATEADIEYCNRYGRSGQQQGGIDIYGRLKRTGRYTCIQAKNRSGLTASQIEKAVDKFLNGTWAERSERFSLCTRGTLADTRLQEEVEVQATRLRKRTIIFEALDGSQLSSRLRAHPDIIDDFFGRDWVDAFCGPDAAAVLARRLDGARIIRLRKRLAEIYDARFRQLDPGLVRDGLVLDAGDIRSRFVPPEVDLSNPYSEPVMEADVADLAFEPTDHFAGDDEEYSFPPHAYIDGRAEPDELIDAPRVPLESWLEQGHRSVLLGGAGFGKSTVLRCLALDLVRAPISFPRVAAQLGQRIPLLIPFALWCRLTETRQREVGLPEVVRETFGAFVNASELESSFLEALLDDRLLLLIDGLDEYSNEQAARLTLATIESSIQGRAIRAIMTARPAGLRRLGSITGDWQIARLTELSNSQQRRLATRLLADRDGISTPIELQVDQFFDQLERTGRLQSLAGNPLLLHGLLSVASSQAILPRTRFQLFQKLVEILLNVHPSRRAVAASEVQARTRAFANDDLRREALSYLAFNIHAHGADAGIDRDEAQAILAQFLSDPEGPGWSKDKAREGAAELTRVDADTSGLLVERSPRDIAFCHAAFREHLAGLELERWPLDRQREFAAANAGDPRWRAPILALIQSFTRQTDAEGILKAVRGIRAPKSSNERALLLADAAFAVAPLAGLTGRELAHAALDRIEDSTDQEERLELLELALDGPRAGPIGEEITARITRWWPAVIPWRARLYAELGNWPSHADLYRCLYLGLHGDVSADRFAAAATLAKTFGGDNAVADQLISLVHSSRNVGITAAALDALSRGWPEIPQLEGLLRQGLESVSTSLQTVSALALYRRGWRDDAARDALLNALDEDRSGFRITHADELATALVADWGADPEVQQACWAGVNRAGPARRRVSYDTARSILLRIHRDDPRVVDWLCEEFLSGDRLLFSSMHDPTPLLEPILLTSSKLRAAVETWFADKKYHNHDHHVSQLAAIHKSDTAKDTLFQQLQDWQSFRFWPVSGLLKGWGMDDPAVAASLAPLARMDPEKRDDIAQYIPQIIRNSEKSFDLLMEICSLPEVGRPDFVIRGFAALGCAPNDAEVVTAVLPHVPARWGIDTGVATLIEYFHGDPRVRAFALERLRRRSPPLEAIAAAYRDDVELRGAVLQLSSPLPTFLRRRIARRASQRFDDEVLLKALEQCDLESDSAAKVQATIGFARSSLLDSAETENRVRQFSDQLQAIGPDMDERRIAAFAGLLALNRNDIFAQAVEGPDNKPLTLSMAHTYHDYAPALELIADRWELVKETMGSSVDRFSRFGGSPLGVWQLLAPYANRSPELAACFIDYCRTSDGPLSASMLQTLWRLKPKSSLLLKSCMRTLEKPAHARDLNPVDVERARIVASKCLCTEFADTPDVQETVLRAAEWEHGAAIVGFAATWPEHSLVSEKLKAVQSNDYSTRGLLWPAILWVIASKGDPATFVGATAQFLTRTPPSLWDFAADSLVAMQSRLERDEEVREHLAALATEEDEPNLRGSVPRLLSSTQAGRVRGRGLAEQLLSQELQRGGLPRYGLDVLTNRLRRVTDTLDDCRR